MIGVVLVEHRVYTRKMAQEMHSQEGSQLDEAQLGGVATSLKQYTAISQIRKQLHPMDH
jgi:hypothetical protein